MGQLTATQLRTLNDADMTQPWLRRGQLAAADVLQLGNLMNFVSGTATVLAAASSVIVAAGLAYDGKPAFALVMQSAADATMLRVERASWDGLGNVTFFGNAAATANTVISYFIDPR